MAMQRRYKFRVRGHFQFPLDMLRYDQCWPVSESSDVPAIYRSIDRDTTQETVELQGLNMPTVARWKSFGWEVVGSVDGYKVSL